MAEAFSQEAYVGFICGFIAVAFVITFASIIASLFYSNRDKPNKQRLSLRQLNKLYPSAITLPSNINNTVCTICINGLSNETPIRVFPCLHAFHVGCVDEWITKYRASCPMCQRNLRPQKSTPKWIRFFKHTPEPTQPIEMQSI